MNQRRVYGIAAAILGVVLGSSAATGTPPSPTAVADTLPATTNSPLAQRFVTQGLNLAFAFNHAEAGRAFREAARLDPDCAMCYWGQALVLGPIIVD